MGLTVLDAGIVVGLLDSNDVHHATALQALSEAHGRNDRLVLPASAFAEVLVGPSRAGPDMVATVRRLVERLPVEIAELDPDVAVAAAALRAPPPFAAGRWAAQRAGARGEPPVRGRSVQRASMPPATSRPHATRLCASRHGQRRTTTSASSCPSDRDSSRSAAFLRT